MAVAAAATRIFEAPDAVENRLRTRTLVIPVAWGVFLFGAVYPWTYRPLMAIVAAAGAYGWLQASAEDRAAARGVAIGLAVVCVAVVAQLIPLSAAMLARISPATDPFLRHYDVAYTLTLKAGQPVMHAVSVVPARTLIGLTFVVGLSLFTMGCAAMLPRMSLTRLLNRLIVIGFIVALFGIVQKATFNDRIYWFWKPVNVANNAFGPFVNRNHFAGWMVMMASLTAGYLRGLISPGLRVPLRSWRERAAWLSSIDASRVIWVAIALFVMVLSIVWSFSRSGMLATAAAGLVLGLHSTARGGRRGSILGIWFVLTALAVAIVWRGTSEVAAWYSRTDTLQWRVAQWRDTLPIVRDFPWLGTGLNTYAASVLLYPTSHPESIVNQAHNDYLQILSEGGIVLCACAIFLIGATSYRTWRSFAEPQSARTYWIRVGAVAGLIAIAIQETVDFSLQMPGNAVLFCVLVAIAIHRPPHRSVAAR